jgi:hypothetical protein
MTKFAAQLLLRSFSPHVRLLLMAIAVHLSTLRPGEGDLSHDIRAKIAALRHFSQSHDEHILSICASFLKRRDQVSVAVFQPFAGCSTLVSNHPDTTKAMLQQVLGGIDYSWIQHVSVPELIEGLNQCEISVWMPEHISACVNFVAVSAFSLETVLGQTAREVEAGPSKSLSEPFIQSPISSTRAHGQFILEVSIQPQMQIIYRK